MLTYILTQVDFDIHIKHRKPTWLDKLVDGFITWLSKPTANLINYQDSDKEFWAEINNLTGL